MNKLKLPMMCLCGSDIEVGKNTINSKMYCTNQNCPHAHEPYSIIDGKPVLISNKLTDSICSASNYHSLVHRQKKLK